MTVITNSVGGYTVTVQATDDQLRAAGQSDTIPIGLLGVRPNGATGFTPLSADQPITVHSQDQPSGAGGDAVSNDYQVQIPFVASGSYSTSLEYIVIAQ